MTTTPLRLALLQYPVEHPASVAAFAAKLDGWLDQLNGRADLAMLPEYACVELGAALASAAGLPTATQTGAAAATHSPKASPDEAAELAAMTGAAEAVLTVFRNAARRHRLWLQPGTLPMRGADGRIHNRAPLINPDGRLAFQDKRVMTRFENERWMVSPGADPAVFETPWGRIGLSVCYDVEFPTHVRTQVEAGAWLILAPSCTDTLHGFNRVRVSAAARAVENQCFVALAPTVGTAPWSAALDVNRGYAAVFTPVDRGFPEDGILARGPMDEPGWVFATLDPARIDRVRQEGGVLNHRDWPSAPFPSAQTVGFA